MGFNWWTHTCVSWILCRWHWRNQPDGVRGRNIHQHNGSDIVFVCGGRDIYNWVPGDGKWRVNQDAGVYRNIGLCDKHIFIGQGQCMYGVRHRQGIH